MSDEPLDPEDEARIDGYNEGFNRGYDAGSLDGADAEFRRIAKMLVEFREDAALTRSDPRYFIALDELFETLGVK